MELLIPGLILVALMVYASTRIKKSAARALESETVETEEFLLEKPEGFIHPLHDDSGFAFSAYSKEFGSGSSERMRQAAVKVIRYEDEDFEGVLERTKHALSDITSETVDENGKLKLSEITGQADENGVTVESYNKIAWKGGKVFALNAVVLLEHKDDYARRIRELMDSFELK